MKLATKTNPAALWIGVIATILLLVLFFVLKFHESSLLELPLQWLFVAAIPILIGLIVGGYVKDLKAGDYSATFAGEEILRNSQPIADSAPANSTTFAPKIPAQGWQSERAREYARTRGYMLSHVYRPSQVRGQIYDISVFVIKHEKGSPTPPRKNLSEIKSAEFFFGESWGNQVFLATGDEGFFGVRTHAWGTFLAACRITFKDTSLQPVILYRYVDFAMASASDEV